MCRESKLDFISFEDVEFCNARGDYMIEVKTKTRGTWTASKITFGEKGITGRFIQ